MRHTPSVLDFQMIDFLYSRGVNFVIVASKCDKLNKTERNLREKLLEKELEKYKDIKKIFFSSVTGEGVEMLKNVINESVKN